MLKKTIQKLGIFDSGLGGLTVLKELEKLPISDILYYADTKHLPYGSKSKEKLIDIGSEIIQFFIEQKVDAIVAACHTMSAVALPDLQKKFPQVIIYGVLESVVEQALNITAGSIGIMATIASINSGAHKKALLLHNPRLTVIEQPCPLLVSLLEQQAHKEIIMQALKEYLQPMHHVDTLVLGCTHYALLKEEIRLLLPSINLVSAEDSISHKITSHLNFESSVTSDIKFVVSGDQQIFQEKSQLFRFLTQ